jgi:hypothetical protein
MRFFQPIYTYIGTILHSKTKANSSKLMLQDVSGANIAPLWPNVTDSNMSCQELI